MANLNDSPLSMFLPANQRSGIALPEFPDISNLADKNAYEQAMQMATDTITAVREALDGLDDSEASEVRDRAESDLRAARALQTELRRGGVEGARSMGTMRAVSGSFTRSAAMGGTISAQSANAKSSRDIAAEEHAREEEQAREAASARAATAERNARRAAAAAATAVAAEQAAEEEERKARRRQPGKVDLGTETRRFVERSTVVAVAVIPEDGRRLAYSFAADRGVIDRKAEQTAIALEEGERAARARGDTQGVQYYQQERTDAATRRLAGRTFVGQEIDAAIPALKAEFGKKIGGFNGLGTDDIINALIANGAFTKGYNPFGGYAANSAWSDRNVRRIDQDGDGQLSTREIAEALRNPNMAKAKAAATAAFTAEIAEHLGDVGKVRAEFDLNRDGKATAREISIALRRRGVTNINQIDTDAELKALIGVRHGPATAPATAPSSANTAAIRFRSELKERMEERMRLYDFDHDGKIEANEISTVARVLATMGITRAEQIDTSAEFQRLTPGTPATRAPAKPQK